MNALARRIARMIDLDGPISVGTYMMLALHDREMGFYAKPESIGAQGAFITAPEISQVFGELIGLWCAASWRDQGSPAQPLLVEVGPTGLGMHRRTNKAGSSWDRSRARMPKFCSAEKAYTKANVYTNPKTR